jgi:hypothetical protein
VADAVTRAHGTEQMHPARFGCVLPRLAVIEFLELSRPSAPLSRVALARIGASPARGATRSTDARLGVSVPGRLRPTRDGPHRARLRVFQAHYQEFLGISLAEHVGSGFSRTTIGCYQDSLCK